MAVREITCQQLVELVTEYLEDRLPVEERLLFEEHLAFCTWCATYLDQMRQTIQVAGTLREDDLDPHARDAMLKVFKEFPR
jgi:anti-sigma factor RsiW